MTYYCKVRLTNMSSTFTALVPHPFWSWAQRTCLPLSGGSWLWLLLLLFLLFLLMDLVPGLEDQAGCKRSSRHMAPVLLACCHFSTFGDTKKQRLSWSTQPGRQRVQISVSLSQNLQRKPTSFEDRMAAWRCFSAFSCEEFRRSSASSWRYCLTSANDTKAMTEAMTEAMTSNLNMVKILIGGQHRHVAVLVSLSASAAFSPPKLRRKDKNTN